MKNTSKTKVAILVGHSLFAESVAQQLHRLSKRLTVLQVDPLTEDVFGLIADFVPYVVIVDEDDADLSHQWPVIDRLLRTFPFIKIICLDSQQQATRIISCDQRSVAKIEDLVKTIELETASAPFLFNEIAQI
jgi:predicted ATP-binding protein involved in virulence